MQLGERYLGSSSPQISTENQEIVPDKTSFYKFSFMPNQDCTVKINKSEPIYISSNLGFSTNEVDRFISSFVVVESGIEFHWIGGAR